LAVAGRHAGISRFARDLGADEATADDLGIMVTRLNARLLLAGLGDAAYPRVAENYTEAQEFAETGKIVVMGGITPGADDRCGICGPCRERRCRPPDQRNIGRRYLQCGPEEKRQMRSGMTISRRKNSLLSSRRAGWMLAPTSVLDIVAGKVIERSGIPLLVLDGRDPERLYQAVVEGTAVGTVVSREDKKPLLCLSSSPSVTIFVCITNICSGT
jgi:uridylate kinase